MIPDSIFGFCVDLKKTAIISLYSINWLVFITETECVYSAVRTGSSTVKSRSTLPFTEPSNVTRPVILLQVSPQFHD
jgi:hypothetical protein